jgi:hypothetical protein
MCTTINRWQIISFYAFKTCSIEHLFKYVHFIVFNDEGKIAEIQALKSLPQGGGGGGGQGLSGQFAVKRDET